MTPEPRAEQDSDDALSKKSAGGLVLRSPFAWIVAVCGGAPVAVTFVMAWVTAPGWNALAASVVMLALGLCVGWITWGLEVMWRRVT